MKVPTIGPAATPAAPRTRGAASADGGRFRDHLKTSADSETDGVQAVTGLSGGASVLAAQEVGDDPERAARQKLARRGEDVLDRLDEIRRDILLGAVPRERLENLAQTLRIRRASVNDPRLIAILDEIELRAAVEIAKLTRGV